MLNDTEIEQILLMLFTEKLKQEWAEDDADTEKLRPLFFPPTTE